MITADARHLRCFQGKSLQIIKATILAVVIITVVICTVGCAGGFQGNSMPEWSPDGTKIAFESCRGGNGDIYVMNADGSNQTNLTNNPTWDASPSWSPDGTKIAFSSGRDGNSEIYVMNRDGSQQTNLTNNPTSDGGPAWSPDGTKIAFESNRNGNSEIYMMNADGSNPINLTNNSAIDGSPSWSPDGTKIAYSSDRDGDSEIYVMNRDGSQQTNLTNKHSWSFSNSPDKQYPAWDSSPSWSPDSTKITFVSYRLHDDWRIGDAIYIMDTDGSNQLCLLAPPSDGGFNREPGWSPDGSKIAFSGGRVRFTAGRDGDVDICVIDVDGSNPTRLTAYWVESRSVWWFTLFVILPLLAFILLAVSVWRFVRHRH
jgi:Tol biopolymer transport system component